MGGLLKPKHPRLDLQYLPSLLFRTSPILLPFRRRTEVVLSLRTVKPRNEDFGGNSSRSRVSVS